jgi:hypothetical protein
MSVRWPWRKAADIHALGIRVLKPPLGFSFSPHPNDRRWRLCVDSNLTKRPPVVRRPRVIDRWPRIQHLPTCFSLHHLLPLTRPSGHVGEFPQLASCHGPETTRVRLLQAGNKQIPCLLCLRVPLPFPPLPLPHTRTALWLSATVCHSLIFSVCICPRQRSQ